MEKPEEEEIVPERSMCGCPIPVQLSVAATVMKAHFCPRLETAFVSLSSYFSSYFFLKHHVSLLDSFLRPLAFVDWFLLAFRGHHSRWCSVLLYF